MDVESNQTQMIARRLALVWRPARLVTSALVTAMLALGCASPNINPALPREHTGYVDLFSDFSSKLSWDVQRFDTKPQEFKKVFYDLDPLEGRILRLSFAPGHHKLRVTFLNQFIAEPAVIELEVRDGEITPVQVELVDAGVTSAQTKATSAGGTAYGRYGRRTKIGSYETPMYRVTTVSQEPQPYQVKQLTPYAQTPTK